MFWKNTYSQCQIIGLRLRQVSHPHNLKILTEAYRILAIVYGDLEHGDLNCEGEYSGATKTLREVRGVSNNLHTFTRSTEVLSREKNTCEGLKVFLMIFYQSFPRIIRISGHK